MNPTIFVLSNASTYGGGERSIEAILPPLAKRFAIVAFAESERHYARLKAQNNPGMTVIRLGGGKGPGSLARDLHVVLQHGRVSPPAALLANANKPALYAALLRHVLPGRPPAVFFVRDFQWRNRREILWLARGAQVIVPSPAVLEHDFWRGVLPSGASISIPNAVLAPARALEAIPGERYILCLANFARWKGIHLLVQAFARAGASELGMRLVVAGSPHDADYVQECRRIAEHQGLGRFVEFRAFVEEPETLYRGCAMVVIPSLSRYGGPETFGRTVIEAWAYAKPVVAFATGGPKYLIRDGVDGYLVPEGDLERLAARMRELWLAPGAASDMGKAGLSRAHNEFSAEGVAGRVAGVIEALVRN